MLAGSLMPRKKKDGEDFKGYDFNTPEEAEAVEQVGGGWLGGWVAGGWFVGGWVVGGGL